MVEHGLKNELQNGVGKLYYYFKKIWANFETAVLHGLAYNSNFQKLTFLS